MSNVRAWRTAQRTTKTLPSGLVVTLKPITLIDLVAQNQLPLALLGQLQSLSAASPTAATPTSVALTDIPSLASAIDAVCLAMIAQPRILDAAAVRAYAEALSAASGVSVEAALADLFTTDPSAFTGEAQRILTEAQDCVALSELPFADKQVLFSVATMGVSSLASFPAS